VAASSHNQDAQSPQHDTLAAAPPAAALPFTRLFLRIGQSSYPYYPYVVLSVERASNQTPGSDDYIALADHYPQNANDFIPKQWQKVSKLDQGSYMTGTWCGKEIGNLIIADLKTLESFYIFYAGTDSNGDYAILGNPSQYKRQTHWMKDSIADIAQKRLYEIVIPGAHDVGTYDMVGKAVAYNAQAQNLSFDGQLELGIRYFDCRIKKLGEAPYYWFYHGINTWTNINDLVSAVRAFLDPSSGSREIVILDFCRLKYFTQQSDYTTLFDYFRKDNTLARAMISPHEMNELTINDFVTRGKRLLILCENAAQWAPDLGESINLDAQWPQKSDTASLKNYLDGEVISHATANSLWSLQAILTVSGDKWLYWYADKVSLVLRDWMLNSTNPTWWNTVNVVFCDFTGGADLVSTAKVCNQLRNNPAEGDLYWYSEPGWHTGQPFPPSRVGLKVGDGGWTNFKSVFASSNGVIYVVKWDGSLWRYRDTHWQNGAPINNPPTLASPAGPGPDDRWDRYRLVFATSDGVIYAIDWSGVTLYRYRDANWQSGLGSMPFTSREVASRREVGNAYDWSHYPSVCATSQGVIYALDREGALWRYRDTAWQHGRQLMPIGSSQLVANAGWGAGLKTVFATSDGIVYAIDWSGNLRWFQDAAWQQGTGQLTGDIVIDAPGWTQFRMVFATGEGRIYAIMT
jgi:Tachylectin